MTRSISSSAVFLGLSCALLVGGQRAEAHEQQLTATRVDVSGLRAQVALQVTLGDLALLTKLDGNDDGFLTRAEYQDVLSQLREPLAREIRLESGEQDLRLEGVHGVFPSSRVLPLVHADERLDLVLDYHSQFAIHELALQLSDVGAEGRRLVEFQDGSVYVLAPGESSLHWSRSRSVALDTLEFGAQGIWHILIGWDHLAFLLGLMLLTRCRGRLLVTVSAFTLAHSVTLGLTVLHVVSPPGALVEAIIALSIVYVGVESLLVKEPRYRFLLTFVFGLVHGMGFGGALLDLELSSPIPALVGFNLGVELGQLAAVLAAFPLIKLARQASWGRWFVPGVSGLLIVAGLAAAVTRIV